MATHPSAEKRNRQNEKRRARNASWRSQYRTAENKLKATLEKKDVAGAGAGTQEVLRKTISTVMRIGSKGILHKKTVARKVARMSRAVQRAIKRKT